MIEAHGYIWWFAWTFFSCAQIWTGRYLVHWWKWRVFAHSALGGLITLLTIATTIIVAIYMSNKLQCNHLHNCSGIILTIICFMLLL